MTPPRSAFGAPPQGGAPSGPAEPVPRLPLGVPGWTGVLVAVVVIAVLVPLLNLAVPADSVFQIGRAHV